MEERTREHVNVAQENSRLHAKLRSTQVQLTEAEARSARFKMLAKTEEQRAQLLEAHSGAARDAAADPVNRNVESGEAAPSAGPLLQQQLRQREDELAAAGAELSNLRQQLMEVLGSNNALQVCKAELGQVYVSRWMLKGVRSLEQAMCGYDKTQCWWHL
jgi:regulator of replication initiation timing